MKKIYYLSTCDTCKSILKEVDAPASYERQDIKKNLLPKNSWKSYGNIPTAMKPSSAKERRLYKERGLKDKDLSEEDYQKPHFRALYFSEASHYC